MYFVFEGEDEKKIHAHVFCFSSMRFSFFFIQYFFFNFLGSVDHLGKDACLSKQLAPWRGRKAQTQASRAGPDNGRIARLDKFVTLKKAGAKFMDFNIRVFKIFTF